MTTKFKRSEFVDHLCDEFKIEKDNVRMLPSVHDVAIIGVNANGRIVYDKEKLVKTLAGTIEKDAINAFINSTMAYGCEVITVYSEKEFLKEKYGES